MQKIALLIAFMLICFINHGHAEEMKIRYRGNAVSTQYNTDLTKNYKQQAQVILDLIKKHPNKDMYSVWWYNTKSDPYSTTNISYHIPDEQLIYMSTITGDDETFIFKGKVKQRLKRAREENTWYKFAGE